ncbi:MAG: hypothetical protein ACT4PL_06015 [Phycisphaerales bacterium]
MKSFAAFSSVVVMSVAGLAASASGEVVLSFGYTDLDGDFVGAAGVGNFTAAATDVGALRTSGDVTRLIPNTGTAEFDAGFFSLPGAADAFFSVSVFNRVGSRAMGLGFFVLTDTNGDTITGDIDGIWLRGTQGRTFFNGNLTNVVTNNNSGDGVFNGTSGSFDIDFTRQSPMNGALVQLFIRTGVGFFENGFSDVTTQVAGELVPTPGATALVGLAAAAALRRRRR